MSKRWQWTLWGVVAALVALWSVATFLLLDDKTTTTRVVAGLGTGGVIVIGILISVLGGDEK